jgi:leader peptidase (prepilin peptidase)/N-methyltransferase
VSDVIVALLFGLCVGSFLNVVVYRLPRMLEQQWQDDCALLASPDTPLPTREPFNLAVPRSRCPHCGHGITALENIPVLSWVFLRGRCSACAKPISARYPLVELATGLLSAWVVARYGLTPTGVLLLLFSWALVALTLIDYDTQLLPDSITLPLLWLGLLAAIPVGGVSPQDAIIGAAAGYLSLWTVYQAFRLLTGKEGMGFGDFKLLAALGAWLGWQKLLLVIILSSGVGAVAGIAMIMLMGRDRAKPIPFGPYLAVAGWLAMMFGNELLAGPLRLFALS